MKNPFDAKAPAFDADAINATIQRALAAAGLDTSAGPMHNVTETIRRALDAGRTPQATERSDNAVAIDEVAQPGSFEAHTYSNRAGSRVYKLYVPAGHSDAPRAMVVMLHGCTQSADDFAMGTGMNRLADANGFLVVYPEQAAAANASKCWNWFNPQDQLHGAGEPSLIAGIVSEVAQRHGADPRRIFVAGLSAGAAMAVVLGETYPALFAAVGAHSGLAYGSANDVVSAMAAMKGGRSGMPGLKDLPGVSATPRKTAEHAMPVIVFHGDRDHTVQQSNSAQIVQQACDAYAAHRPEARLALATESGVSLTGQRFTRAVHTDAQGQARIENWTVHGAGHAWSGGNAKGSYTDASGPDASAEMVRFFLSQPVVDV